VKRLLLCVTCAAALAGCATPTAFAPASGSARASGFWDTRIEADRFRISYRGGSGAPAALVQDYALLHAADLTLAEGYDWFQVVGRFGEVAQSGGSSLSVGGGSSHYGRRSSSGFGLGFEIPLGGGPQLTETLEIVMGKGARPEGRNAYGARDVQTSLRGRRLGA